MKNNMLARFRNFIETNPLAFFVFASVLQYREILFFNKKIGWDTLDAIFPHFLFMVDAFKNLSIPYYNPLIQGGFSFGENFFTAFLINPIDIMLALFSTFLPPLFVFQLQFPVLAALSGYWVYRFFYKMNNDQFYALLGGFCYFSSMLFPVAGQLPFFYAFVLLAFLLGALNEYLETKSLFKIIVLLVIFTSLLVKTYYFFIPFFLTIGFIISVKYYRMPLLKMLMVYGLVSLTYIFMTFPILFYLKSSMSDLYGTFLSPEPRLRSLVPEEVFYHGTFRGVIADVVDNRILRGGGFTRGFNIGLVLLFIIQFWFLLTRKKRIWEKFLFLSLMILSMFFANGNLSKVHSLIPLIKTFRWGFSYVHFSQIFFLFLIFFYSLKDVELKKTDKVVISVLFVLFFGWIIYMAENLKYLVVLPAVPLFVYFLFKKENWLIPGIFTLCFIYMFKGVDFNKVPDMGERKNISNRKTKVRIVHNIREPGKFGDYEWADRSWLYLKEPTLNGYNNSIHPIFWYLKGHIEANKIMIPLCTNENLSLKERNLYPKNDNEYLEAYKNDLLQMIQKYKCPEDISAIDFSMEGLSFKTQSTNTLVLQNMDPFILKPVSDVKESILPGGIRLITSPENFSIKYDFEKKSWIKNILINLLFLGLLISYGLKITFNHFRK